MNASAQRLSQPPFGERRINNKMPNASGMRYSQFAGSPPMPGLIRATNDGHNFPSRFGTITDQKPTHIQ